MHFYFVSLPNSMGEMVIVETQRMMQAIAVSVLQKFKVCLFLCTLKPNVNGLFLHSYLCFSVRVKPVMLARNKEQQVLHSGCLGSRDCRHLP